MFRVLLLFIPALIACSSPSLSDPTGDVYLLIGQSNMVRSSRAMETALIRSQGQTVTVLKAAKGGTSITQWQKGGMLYAKALEQVRSQERPVKAIFWHQGEQDAYLGTSPAEYERLLTQLFMDLRADVGDVPIVVGEIGRWLKFPSLINDSIHHAAHNLPSVSVVSSAGLVDDGDLVHFNTASEQELAYRYVAALLASTIKGGN